MPKSQAHLNELIASLVELQAERVENTTVLCLKALELVTTLSENPPDSSTLKQNLNRLEDL